MYRLHRRDDPVLAEQREFCGIDDLRMLDPPAPVAFVGFGHILDRPQHIGICRIADRVDRDLEFVHRGAAHQIA